MTPLRHRLAVLAAVAIGDGGLAAQDQLVLQALKKIESVEAGLKGLAPGDIPAANSLLADLKWAEKRLNAAYKKDTEDWKAAAKRLADADKAVRSQAAAKSAGSPAGANPEALSGAQQEKLQQLSKEVNNGQNNLRLLNKTFMGDAFRVGSTTKEIAGLKTRLAEFPSENANVKVVAGNLAAFEQLFLSWQAEYKADTERAVELTPKLAALSTKYAADSVPGPMHWPYEQEKLTIWASRTHTLLLELPADTAFVAAATQNSIVGKQAADLQHWLGTTIQNRLNEQVQQVQQACNQAVADALNTAKVLREIQPDDHHAIVNRVLAEGALERSMKSLQEGLEAVSRAAALDQAMAFPNAPDRTAQGKEIEATIEVLRSLARSALAEVRLPRPVSLDDKEMAELTRIAQETLAKKKYGVNEIARLVVTSKISRKEKREGTIRGTTTGASITSYHYVWDEYHVVTAEKVGDEVWVYHNLLKYYHSSDTVTPQDEWILSQRFPSTQILPENLSK